MIDSQTLSALYQTGLSQREIAVRYGTTKGTITRLMKVYRIQTRYRKREGAWNTLKDLALLTHSITQLCNWCGAGLVAGDNISQHYFRRHFYVCKKCEARMKRVFYENHKEQMRQYTRNQNRKFRLLALQHYGGKCACCGETQMEFLTLSHPNNDGAKHRREIHSQMGWSQKFPTNVPLAQYLAQHGFPNGYTIIVECWNCNCARAYGGGCPHKKIPIQIAWNTAKSVSQTRESNG